MDYRLYILAGTFLLLLIAFVTFVVTLARSRRHRDHPHFAQGAAAEKPGRSRPVDASLAGLELEVSADAPSAALLTPLKTGEWMPDEEQPTPRELAKVSLSERRAEFVPEPDVPEPPFSVEPYPAWKVAAEETATGQPPVEIPPAPAVLAPEAARATGILIPEVHPSPPGSSTVDEDEFSAEIAALLPLEAAYEPEPAPAPAPEPAPAPAPEPAPAPAPEPAPVPAPVPAPEPAPEPEPAPKPEPAPAPVPEAAPAPESRRRPVPAQRLQPPRPVAEASPATERPAAIVSSAEPPPPPPRTDAFAERPRRPRPTVRVHAGDGDQVVLEFAASVPPVVARDGLRRDQVPELVMSAPVEMWFGEARVGVKAGTASYDRFRKYADALLSDLKAAPRESR